MAQRVYNEILGKLQILSDLLVKMIERSDQIWVTPLICEDIFGQLLIPEGYGSRLPSTMHFHFRLESYSEWAQDWAATFAKALTNVD